jgi:hypothetical protein
MMRADGTTAWFSGPWTEEAWEAQPNETRRLPAVRSGLLVEVLAGQVVVTQAGHAEDLVLEAGQSVRLDGPGLGVAWALQASRVVIRRAARPGAGLAAPRSRAA